MSYCHYLTFASEANEKPVGVYPTGQKSGSPEVTKFIPEADLDMSR